jgi:uncharacterized integral membrane protein
MCDSRGVDNLDLENHQPPAKQEPREPLNKALIARLVVAAVIVAIFIIFAVQNTESVTIEFLSWNFQLSQFLMMVLSAVAGVVIWEFAGVYSKRAKKKRSS